ncbi:MAG TPA: response regulator transcription factor [Thermoanaerobaculia bacterium]|nr:response regulator transcription factor [Thermoanaerobaculia bacterium]
MTDRRRILVVEDDEELLFGLQDRLESEGYEVIPARDGIDALTRASARTFDCIVLDIALPRKNGFEVCRDLRERNDRTPILMLTARSEVSDRVRGLQIGADDYLVKPFAPMELVARIGALIRRSARPRTVDRYSGGGLTLDFNDGTAVVRGTRVELSKMEMKLLEYLVEHRASILSRQELLDNVWGHASTVATRTVDMHIAMLRQKLEVDPARPELILTVHRGGYKFSG